MTTLWRDVRTACRGLAKQPAFSLMSVGILAIGIAATTMVFGLFNGLFLHAFPVPEQDRLVDLNETAPKWDLEYTGVAYPDFCAWREHNKSFDSMYAWTIWGANLAIDGKAERVDVFVTTHDFFEVMSVRPVLGRGFTEEEDRPNGPNKVVLLSTGLWNRMSGKDPTIVGRTLRLDGDLYTVIGVLPPEAEFPLDVDLWRPLAADPQQRGSWYLQTTGRLKTGVTVGQARDDLTRIHQAMIDEKLADAATSPTVVPLRESMLGDYRQGLTILLSAVGFVLLIACCNVTSIMLARGTHRGKEIATRLALGATRRRIMTQVLTESVVLSLAGAVVGVPLGRCAIDLLMGRLVSPLDIPRWLTFQADLRWMLFGLLAIGATTVLSGIIPALHAIAERNLHVALQASATRSTSSRAARRTLSGVVVGQVALALTLLIGTGLVLRAFQKVQAVDPGCHIEGVLTYQITLPHVAYPEAGNRQVFFEQHLERVRALPGVTAAGLVSGPPMSNYHNGARFEAEGAMPKAPDEQEPIVLYLVAMPGYLEAMGIKLLSGRFFSSQDNQPDSERTVIVNESLVRQFWPGQDAVNKRIRRPGSQDWMRVIGVTRDVRHYGLEEPMRPGVYVPYGLDSSHEMYGVVRTTGDPFGLVSAIRELIRSADPDLPIHDIKTMSQRVHASMMLRAMFSWMFGLFGGIAAIMAFAGIYGVISYWVSRRTQEIGIRVALGAREPDVVKMVVGQGLRLIGIGLGLGLLGAFGLSRLLAGMLFHVSPTDPLTFAVAGLLLAAAGILACYVPARRAARIDPMSALRYE